MPSANEVLAPATLTESVNEMKAPNSFLWDLLFAGRQEPIESEQVQIDTIVKGREMAPFVRKNGQGILFGGYSETKNMVEAPNIRLKRNLDPNKLMFERRAGAFIYTNNGANNLSVMEQHIATEQKVMLDGIVNTKEWMVAQVLTGTVTYSVSDEEVYTITYPKPPGNTITLPAANRDWDIATTSTPFIDVLGVKQVMSDEVSLQPTDAICGANAGPAMLSNAEIKDLLDKQNISAGTMTLIEQFQDTGAIFLGNMFGVRWWYYPRTVIDPAGNTVKMVRDDYVEFVHAGPAAQNTCYYGAIPDMDAFDGRTYVGPLFSKSWNEQDPSVKVLLVHSRPLCVPRRPGSYVSLKIVNNS